MAGIVSLETDEHPFLLSPKPSQANGEDGEKTGFDAQGHILDLTNQLQILRVNLVRAIGSPDQAQLLLQINNLEAEIYLLTALADAGVILNRPNEFNSSARMAERVNARIAALEGELECLKCEGAANRDDHNPQSSESQIQSIGERIVFLQSLLSALHSQNKRD
jgi:hypothetical protein